MPYEVWLRSGRSSSILAKRTQNIGEGVGGRLSKTKKGEGDDICCAKGAAELVAMINFPEWAIVT